MKNIISTLFFCAVLLPAYTVDLYYTEDGRTVKSLRGYFIQKDLTLVDEGEESWLVVIGQQIGPNGYMAKQSRLTLGALGKKQAFFIESTEAFLGFGHGRRYERPVKFEDIAYILPNKDAIQPAHVVLKDGATGELFVAGEYTECTGEKVIRGKKINTLTVVRLKYDVPKSERTPATRPRQYGIKVKAISFSESGLRKALRKLR
jgi:hypothetical protein